MILQILFIALHLVGFSYLECSCPDKHPPRSKSIYMTSEEYDQLDHRFCVSPEDENGLCHELNQETKYINMTLIRAGTFTIGTNSPHFEADRESPECDVDLRAFYMDRYEVSNRKFMKFVKAMGYVTEAEDFGDSFLFKSFLSEEMRKKYEDFRVVGAPWWYMMTGVNWKHPYGPESNVEDILDHPVVHVTYNDAAAFCRWEGKRLPTEGEWEAACRGGRKGKLFPWGNRLMPDDEHRLNIWHGEFPDNNTKDDGYEATCSVYNFRQNDYKMHNIVGNVWEWTSTLWDPKDKSHRPNRVKKGGSYLCHESYCYRYRCAARSQNTEDSSAGNLGFRCAMSYDLF